MCQVGKTEYLASSLILLLPCCVPPDSCSIGEYMTLAEVRDAIDKLSGAAINGGVVKLSPLVRCVCLGGGGAL